jgi:hypothetical protein
LRWRLTSDQNPDDKSANNRRRKQQSNEPKALYPFQSVIELSVSFIAGLGWGVGIGRICAIAV